MTDLGRGMGAAQTGNVKQAREDIEKLRAAHEADLAKPDQAYWAGQTNILISAGSAWLAHAEGNSAEAIKLMRAAADLEDSSGKTVARKNRLFPMRDPPRYMLLDFKHPRQDFNAFPP